MDLSISKCSYEGKWYDFGSTGARVRVRAYPASRSNIMFKEGAVLVSGEASFDKFSYCLVGWEGFGENGKPIELTEDVKKKIFDFHIGSVTIDGKEVVLSAFVIQKAEELLLEMGELEKN